MLKRKGVRAISLLVAMIMILGVFAVSSPIPVSAAGVNYYVDAIGGNDNNSGTSTSSAWKTLTKVNGMTFLPGDKILFKAGCSWTGQLHPLGSGSSTSAIIIDMYGTEAKPVINGNGMTGQAPVYLYNQQYWEINNLAITNNASTSGDRRGVLVEAANYGTVNHIYLKHLDIHDVKGIVSETMEGKNTAGIAIWVLADDSVATRFNDILIEGCTIHDVSNEGIITLHKGSSIDYPGTGNWTSRRFSNLAIRNNTIYNITKNGMILRLLDNTCVVEYNVCHDTATAMHGNTIYTAGCNGTVFQYNEGYLNKSPDGYDGSMYDADLKSPNTVWQYSYSHDNIEGLMWFCTVLQDTGIIVRYNISQNDKNNIFRFEFDLGEASIYNNVVYIAPGLTSKIIGENGSKNQTYSFYNNIIYNLSSSAGYSFSSTTKRTIDYNVFYGQHPTKEPADAHKLTSDPKFVNPGGGGYGINSLDGYKLQASSPCINSGKSILNNGGKDYWGNPLYQGAPDRGAFEYQGASTPTPTPTPGVVLQYSPVDDAYVRGGVNADTNYGSGTALEVKRGSMADNYRKVYMKYDLSSAGLSSVASAKVILYCDSLDAAYAITAYESSDSWTEEGITWNTAPALGTSIGSTTVSSTGAYYVWDITSYVNNQLAGDKVVSVAFNDANSKNLFARFSSKEAASNPPRLEIVK